READRRLPARGPRSPRARWLSTPDRDGHLPGSLSREPRDAEAARGRPAAALSICTTTRESRLPPGTPDHGAGAIVVVSTLRSQPADLRPEHLRREAGRLQEGHPARLPRTGTGQLHRAPDREALSTPSLSLLAESVGRELLQRGRIGKPSLEVGSTSNG